LNGSRNGGWALILVATAVQAEPRPAPGKIALRRDIGKRRGLKALGGLLIGTIVMDLFVALLLVPLL